MKRKIVIVIAMFVGVFGLTACNPDGGSFNNPSSQTTVSQAPKKISLPNAVAKQNAAVVQDRLRKLGLKKVELASVDPQAKVVVLPQDWTVVSIEPASGTTVEENDVVVLKVTKHP